MSSPPEQIEVKCPSCGTIFKTWHRGSMNLTMDNFSQDYIRRMTTADCPDCKQHIVLGSLIVGKDNVWRFGSGDILETLSVKDKVNTAVLGIDAAWTTHQPSGIALVARQKSCPWRCMCVAPSYESFILAAEGHPVQWDAPKYQVNYGNHPNVGAIIDAASHMLSGRQVDLVTIDMPISLENITRPRAADNAISSEFGAAGCGTHSPTWARVGEVSSILTADFACLNFTVATKADESGKLSRLVEVYPHPALLRLLNETYRLRYKVSKSHKYWPKATVAERIEKLLEVYGQMLKALNSEIDGIDLPLPVASSCSSLSSLKRYEDALDALVCAWVGCRYMQGQATPFGDHTAAIWVPNESATGDISGR